MRLIWVVIPLVLFALFPILDVDAGCAGPYPCRAPGDAVLSAEIWFQSDTIVSGKIIGKSYGADALSHYNDTNSENPCNLFTANEEFVSMLANKTIPLSERLQHIEKLLEPAFSESLKNYWWDIHMEWYMPDRVTTQIKENEDFLQNSELKIPFRIEMMVDTVYKGNVTQNKIDVFGIEKSKLYSQQFSHGYFIDPEIGEEVLLYLKYHDQLQFDSCIMPNVYKVDGIQSSIWGWNEDDFKPDIYPNDIKIPSLKEQSTYQQSGNRILSTMLDLIACPLGLEPMYRTSGSPFCVTSSTADKIDEKDYAKQFSYFWEFNYWNEPTENYERLKEIKLSETDTFS